MTFSIVATDGESWGVAVASKFLAVGAAVPAARAGIGALATQAMANLAYKRDGLALLADSYSAEDVVAGLIGRDAQAAHRQLGVVDRAGTGASHTGSACISWAGQRTGVGYAIQGNCLAGEDVVDAMQGAWLGSEGTLMRRLLATVAAGDGAGGDKRGRQSSALYVVREDAGYGGGDDVAADLRVDDHDIPVGELGRLLDLHELYFGKPEQLLALDGELRDEVVGHLARLGYDVADFEQAYGTWVGTENYEERHVPGRIDALVLERMRAQQR